MSDNMTFDDWWKDLSFLCVGPPSVVTGFKDIARAAWDAAMDQAGAFAATWDKPDERKAALAEAAILLPAIFYPNHEGKTFMDGVDAAAAELRGMAMREKTTTEAARKEK